MRIRPETAGFRAAATSQITGALRQTERDTARFTKGVVAGSGALHGLGRAAVFASSSVLGGYGLAYALRTVTKAATDHVALEGQLRNAVERSGLSYQQNAAAIQKVVAAQENLGFAENVSIRAFTLALRATGSIAGANRLLATSANVARGANKDLYTSTLVLVRAYDGATTGLKRLGIQVKAGSKGFDAINQVQAKYAGAAVKYADSAAGAQARLDVAIHRTEVTIGTALLPTITRLSTHLADWLDKSKNQERIQRDVNTVVKDGSEVVHGLAEAFRILAPPVETAVTDLGGLEKVARNLFLAFAAWKAAKLISEFRAVGAAAGSAGAAGEVGLLTTRATALSRIGPIVIPVTVALSLTESSGYKAFFGRVKHGLGSLGFLATPFESLPSVYDQFRQAVANVGAFGEKRLTAAQAVQLIKSGKLDPATLARLQGAGLLEPGAFKAAAAAFKAQGNFFGAGFLFPPQAAAPTLRPEQGGTVLAPSGGGALLGRGARIQQALDAAARTTRTTADDLKALTAQHLFLADQIAAERKRLETALTKKQAQKFADNLHALEQQDAQALGQIQSIEDQAAADAKAKADKAAAAAKKAADAKAAAAKKLLAIEAFAVGKVADAFRLFGPNQDVLIAAQKAAADAAQKAKEAAAKAAATALTIREGGLNIARQAADLATARAGSNDALLTRANALAEKADRKLIAFYKARIKATKGLARQNYQQQLIQAQIDLAGLGKKAKASSGFTLAQLYAEAEQEYKMYGSNYGPDGTPLSPQAARGAFSGIVLKQGKSVHVTQIFAAPTRPSQAMNDARAGARYLN